MNAADALDLASPVIAPVSVAALHSPPAKRRRSASISSLISSLPVSTVFASAASAVAGQPSTLPAPAAESLTGQPSIFHAQSAEDEIHRQSEFIVHMRKLNLDALELERKISHLERTEMQRRQATIRQPSASGPAPASAAHRRGSTVSESAAAAAQHSRPSAPSLPTVSDSPDADREDVEPSIAMAPLMVMDLHAIMTAPRGSLRRVVQWGSLEFSFEMMSNSQEAANVKVFDAIVDGLQVMGVKPSAVARKRAASASLSVPSAAVLSTSSTVTPDRRKPMTNSALGIKVPVAETRRAEHTPASSSYIYRHSQELRRQCQSAHQLQ